VGVFFGVGSLAVTEHMLCNLDPGHLIKMGCGRMTEQPGMQLFINTELICRGSEDILEGARGDAFFSFGDKQRSFITPLRLQIATDDFTKAVRQHDISMPSPFFPDPQQAAGEIDILNIQCGQGAGSKTKSTQQHDDDKISKAHW